MKSTYSLILVLVLVLLHSRIILQAQTKQVQGKTYTKGIIFMKDNNSYEANSIKLGSTEVTFSDKSTSRDMAIPLDDVRYVRAKTGTWAVEGGVGLGLLCLASSLAAWADVEADPYTTTTNGGAVVGGMTVGGLVVGFLIGSLFPKEKVIYKDKSLTTIYFNREQNLAYGKNGINTINIRFRFGSK